MVIPDFTSITFWSSTPFKCSWSPVGLFSLVLHLVANTLIIVVFIGILNKQLAICKVDSLGNVIGGQGGCYNLIPVFDWVRRSIISIFLVFMVAFLPLFLQGQS